MMAARPDEDGYRLLRLLDSTWRATQQHRHDDLAGHFDRVHAAPLVNESRAYVRALGECMELLGAAERDTADWVP
jgi:hypothetical protein